MKALEKKLHKEAAAGLAAGVWEESAAYGKAVGEHIFAWSKGDGGAVVENLGFPAEWKLTPGPAHWVPTSTIALQQAPLLPTWGNNQPIAMPESGACPLPPPPDYSEDKESEFYKQALEVYGGGQELDARSTRTSPVSGLMIPCSRPRRPATGCGLPCRSSRRRTTDLEKSVEVLARLGIAISDGFIACWRSKFEFDLVRPVTYIKRVIDKSLGAAADHAALSGISQRSLHPVRVPRPRHLAKDFGDTFAFTDATHVRDGLAAAQLQVVLGSRTGSGGVASLRRHPFQGGD
jgi:hypothetical protein